MGVIRTKKYAELSTTMKIQADCDMKAINIILQGLLTDIYSLVNHHRVAKDLWEKVRLLMQGTSLTKQERECKLYDAFDKFVHIKRESLHYLPPEWSKFVTDVKLIKDLHTTNFDQLHAYLEQHELHANKVRLMRKCSQDPLALVANHQMTPSHFNTYQSSYNNPQQGDDHIDAINKMMSFLSTVSTSCFPSTNNQLRNPSKKRQQATIHDGRVTVQPLQGRQNFYVVGTLGTIINTSGTGGNSNVLNEEELEFLAHLGIAKAKAVLMANMSSYKSDVLSEMSYSEQTHIVNYLENGTTSDRNVIPYSQYLLETQNAAVHNTNFST
ncbi:hypothetical protein Tco_0359409 [Tanacetum coccineum]